MPILELTNFRDEQFKACFRAYFLEIGISLREDTDVFDEITESYKKENMRTFVIAAENGFAGFVMIQPECLKGSFFEEKTGFIRELWVAPGSRYLGYGEKLVQKAEEVFKAQGIMKLILTYEEDALRFYKKQGFQPDRTYRAKNNGNIAVKYL